MRCFIAFTALFLAVLFDQGVTTKILKVTIDQVARFNIESPPGKLINCTATNKKVSHRFYPSSDSEKVNYAGRGESCSFTLSAATFDDAGIWSIETIWYDEDQKYDTNINAEFEVYVVENIPHDTYGKGIEYEIADGNYVAVVPEKLFDITDNCTLTKNNDKTYKLLEIDGNSELELHGHCGVRLLCNNSIAQTTWNLEQTSGYKIIKYRFQINIMAKSNVEYYEETLWWSIGSKARLSVANGGRIKYCTIIKPDGKIVYIENDDCIYELPKVDTNHGGIWKIRYPVRGNLRFSERQYTVNVYDSELVNTSTNIFSDEINMLCRIPLRRLNYCVFTRSDGLSINLPQGMDNDGTYQYFGNGYKRSLNDYSDCGLKIRNPEVEDFALWKCTLGFTESGTEKTVNGFISLADIDTMEIPTHIYVKRGDDFTVTCETTIPLEYCWLRSPIGTMYTVVNTKTSNNTLPYVGEGLQRGVCGARVENASDEHAGSWSCRMGVIEGGEIEVPVTVTVTESYLYTNDSQRPRVDDVNLTLACNVLPERESVIRYCRWLRPDGYGIHHENSQQYSTSHNEKTCILNIKQDTETNAGNWMCYAGLSDDLHEEVFATIIVFSNKYSNSDVTTIPNIIIISTITIIVLVTIIIGASLYQRKRLKRKQERRRNIETATYENNVEILPDKI